MIILERVRYFGIRRAAMCVLLSAVSAGVLFAGEQGAVFVSLAGFRHADGPAGVVLFAGPKGFPDNEKAGLRRQFIPVHISTAAIVFEDVPFGSYAVSAFHDENRNGKLDRTFFGMPREGVGWSHNAPLRSGRPRYGPAQFEVHSDTVSITIIMQYSRE